MTFGLRPNDEQDALKQTLHEFAEEIVRPAARDCEAAGATSDDIMKQVFEIGIAAPVDDAFGGGGVLDPVTYCIAAEELAWGDPGIAYQVLGSGLAAIFIGLAGSEGQRRQHLPAFAEAPTRSFVAITEKIAAGDLEDLRTEIDGATVSGEKYGVLDAEEAMTGVVVGRTSESLAAVLVEPGSYGIVKPEHKLGLEAAPTWIVRFDGAAEPLEGNVSRAVLWAKLMTGAVALGCARASLEYASAYAIEREAFGKPIGAFQGVSFKIADMATEIDATRMVLWRAAWKLDRGVATLADIAEANSLALQTAVKCGDDGVQVLGGHGYIRDHPVEKWFRDAVTLSVADAPDAAGDVMVARSVFE